jgi:hypothetical protein
MGYYIRVLGTRDKNVPLSAINSALKAKDIPLSLAVEGKKSDPWNEILLSHDDGTTICQIERNSVTEGELGEEEIEEFIDSLEGAKPESAAEWLRGYLPKVKVIYAFQILNGSDMSFGWEAIGAVRHAIWECVGGILQADSEGFSNEDGNHILWEFSDSVKGAWQMAVLNGEGVWVDFQMELGNREHRRAFLAGKVPEGVEAKK